jgi:serine/threonine protein kinase
MDWEAFYNHFRKKDFIPGYEIQVRLGGGAFGDVYKARKESIGKSYAIKFLKVEDGQEAMVERELAQVGHFASIDHPNLVTIEDMGVVMGVPYLIMGYAGEQTLAKQLKEGPLTEPAALALFLQICRGVALLHDKSLVHFDLKPGNVFLQGPRARVGDYGLAKFFEQGNQELSIGRGTPHYMAPEILRGRGDHRADIYSLGVMLYECLLGEKPHCNGDDPLAIRQKEDPAPHTDGISDGISRVILRCLCWEPEERYASVADLMGDLAVHGAESGSTHSTEFQVRKESESELATSQPMASQSTGEGAMGSRQPGGKPVQAKAEFVGSQRRRGWVSPSLFVIFFCGLGFVLTLGGMALMSKVIG